MLQASCFPPPTIFRPSFIETLGNRGEPKLMLSRVVEPEVLDGLPEGDPGALANRKDMRRINRLMGNFRWFAQTLAPEAKEHGTGRPRRSLIEWAAGDGSLGTHLQKQFPVWAKTVDYTGMDLWGRPANWPEGWQWRQENMLTNPLPEPVTTVLANHILHQFSDSELAQIGDHIAQTPTLRQLIINETARGRIPLWLARATRLIGMHPISLHDAVVSVRAGFRGEELPQRLGLDPARWHWQIRTTTLGAYRFAAQRREAPE